MPKTTLQLDKEIIALTERVDGIDHATEDAFNRASDEFDNIKKQVKRNIWADYICISILLGLLILELLGGV